VADVRVAIVLSGSCPGCDVVLEASHITTYAEAKNFLQTATSKQKNVYELQWNCSGTL